MRIFYFNFYNSVIYARYSATFVKYIIIKILISFKANLHVRLEILVVFSINKKKMCYIILLELFFSYSKQIHIKI